MRIHIFLRVKFSLSSLKKVHEERKEGGTKCTDLDGGSRHANASRSVVTTVSPRSVALQTPCRLLQNGWTVHLEESGASEYIQFPKRPRAVFRRPALGAN